MSNSCFQIASHNTMSYAKPKLWILRPFHFLTKCQNINIQEQYEKYSVHLFDIRIRMGKNNKWEFAHGIMAYDCNVEQTMDFINSKGDCTVRLILECNRKTKKSDVISEQFIQLCEKWINIYSNIIFYEFRRKYDWYKLFSYDKEPQISLYQAVSSMTMGIWDDWWPWLYAKTHNKDNLMQGTCADYMAIDFIGMTK